MDYGQVMYLTNFIKNDVSGKEDQLRSIYERAVRESDSYRELEEIRRNLVFFDHGAGASLSRECDHLLEAVWKEPQNGPDILNKMKSLVNSIRAEEKRSVEVLKACEMTAAGVSVLERELNQQYGDMLNILASSLVFMLLISGETGRIHSLRWNDCDSLNVKLDIINNEILRGLLRSSSDVLFWRITKRPDGNRLRFCDFRYQLEYISYDYYVRHTKELKMLNDNLYVDEAAEQTNLYSVVYAGMGNIVSCRARDCINSLSGCAVGMDDSFGQVTEEAAAACETRSILCLLALMSDGRVFAVSPEKATDLLNQMANAREIHDRRQHGQCLFCKKPLSAGTVCPEHFNIERLQ
ncbi:MAG: hypothetical protein IJ801_00930 [Lachnospiraceae bacterium]|nr:hypothetical protein [Lachnospiraceae bacterium]